MDSHFWENAGVGLVGGLVASLVASAGFWFLLYRVRPKIEISPKIARTLTDDGHVFRIKLVNKSRFPAVDVQFAVYLRSKRNVAGGEVYGRRQLDCESSVIPVLSRYSKDDDQAEYALRIKINDSLDEVWKNDSLQSIRIALFARHGFSGAFNSFKMDYFQKSDIEDGNFRWGESLLISPRPVAPPPSSP